MASWTIEEIVLMLKALSDPARLQIVGLLARRPHAVEEIATTSGLSASTVSHHLGRLRDAKLVRSERSQYYVLYSLEQDRLRDLGQQLAAPPSLLLPEIEADSPEAYDRVVLERFLANGRLVSIPRQRKKRDAILRFLARRFERGRVYDETEVNEVLRRFHEDVATLRRDMIASGLFERTGGRYRLREPDTDLADSGGAPTTR
jgi:biotin operon repressor